MASTTYDPADAALTGAPADPAADLAVDAPDPDIVHGGHGYATNTGISNTKLAMWLFLGSECLLFGGLITTYLLYKIPTPNSGPGPQLSLIHISEPTRPY